jgi:uncharacterized protein YjeT (DUF2065 family)
MSVVPIPRQAEPKLNDEPSAALRLTAGSALLAGAVLLLSGKRRAGLVATAAGTALTLLHEKETTLRWWAALPLVLNNVQNLVGKAQTAMDEVNARKDKIRGIFRR